jgi:hypothetical protein
LSGRRRGDVAGFIFLSKIDPSPNRLRSLRNAGIDFGLPGPISKKIEKIKGYLNAFPGLSPVVSAPLFGYRRGVSAISAQ